MLQGYHISPIQFYALQLLELLDEIKEIDDRDWRLRQTLVSAGRVEAEDAFPELATVVTDDAAPMAEESDAEGNAIPVKYIFKPAEYDPKKVEEEVREMLERAAQMESSFETPDYDEWQ